MYTGPCLFGMQLLIFSISLSCLATSEAKVNRVVADALTPKAIINIFMVNTKKFGRLFFSPGNILYYCQKNMLSIVNKVLAVNK